MTSNDKEERRMRTLALYRILDTASETVFDDLTKLAAAICDTPVSLISLVDKDRQWFKSRYGLAATETPRSMSFCAHAILQDELMVVEDATLDERFSHNPLVTSDPSIRFYAGAPLTVSNGLALGSLCVIDTIPRVLTAHQLGALRTLRNAVVAQLELQRAVSDLRALESTIALCTWCRNVRRNDGSWVPLHEYVMDLASVTHRICPICESSMKSTVLT